ncbi:MAG: hypothetical protein O6928_10725 [Gammaproteobacteria bacterium]|nr:hypothetical protein [Gammaproteobacteria bacterium]
MNKTIKILFFGLIITVFGCSDDKASSTQQAPASKAETMATSEPTMDSMDVSPWASLEQEVIYYTDE